MDEISPHVNSPERKYSVIRYVEQWPIGRFRTVLAEKMTFEEAVDFARAELDGLESQGLFILDSAHPEWEFNCRLTI